MKWLYDFLNNLHKALRGSTLDKDAFYFYEQALAGFEPEKIKSAILEHTKASRFFPAPAEILHRMPKPPAHGKQSGPSFQEIEKKSLWRGALASEFKRLPQEKKQQIKDLFLNHAHKSIKTRLKHTAPEKLGELLIFQLFLEANANRKERKKNETVH